MKILTKLIIAFVFMTTQSMAQNITFNIDPFHQNVKQEKNCISQVEYDFINQEVKRNMDSLLAAGVFNNFYTEAVVNFEWPLNPTPGTNWNRNYGIGFYVDHDSSSGIQDYNCDTLTYNGHYGTDIGTFPYPWYLMRNNLAEIVAAADGIITYRADAFPDSNCSWTQGQFDNSIYLVHSDGSKSFYGHMKRNSVTSKLVGNAVTKGEYLGIVGSSGKSNGPHLHFEVRDSMNNLIDPYAGSCNNMNANSYWVAQRPHKQPSLNAIFTHSEYPRDFGCPSSNELPYFSDQYFQGDTIYASSFYTNNSLGDPFLIRLIKPDNTLWNSWPGAFPTAAVGGGSNIVLYEELPPNGPFGQWTYEVDAYGVTLSHKFNYGYPVSVSNLPHSQNNISVVPNPIKGTATITYSSKENVEASLFDLLGRKQTVLFEVTKTQHEERTIVLTRNGQAPGIYILSVRQDNGDTQLRKIVFE